VGKHFERLRRDCAGQDLIEYALMAGFVAVSAAALLPNIGPVSGRYFPQWDPSSLSLLVELRARSVGSCLRSGDSRAMKRDQGL
jgi:Flp pilus assembly pilin Flp